ncbi:MAG: phytanoyl-CoA dioxygenase family protein [Planctomycetota bacterium]
MTAAPTLPDLSLATSDRRDAYRVTTQEYRYFRQWGYLIVRGLLNADEVAELKQHTVDLMNGDLPEQQDLEAFDPEAAAKANAESVGGNGDRLYRKEGATSRHLVRPAAHLTAEQKAQQFLRIHMLHRQIALHERYLLHPRVLDVLEVLIGPDVSALQSMLFLKPPGKVGQGWHQDSYYIPTTPDTLCGAWVAIDDADEYNGGLWLAKGSGAEPVHPPCPEVKYGFGDRMIRDVKHIKNASDPDDSANHLTEVADRYDHVLATVKAGDVVFFNGHILHRSKDNITEDRFRRAFVGHYCNARSFTSWGRDEDNPSGFDEATGSNNGSHILARGDTHLAFTKPKFGTPCAALIDAEARGVANDRVVRQIAAMNNGLMGCAITDLDSLEHDHDDEGESSGY